MSDMEDEGGDSPCWAHEFEDELFGDGAVTADDDADDPDAEASG